MATGLDRIAELVKTKPEYKLQALMHLINVESLADSHCKMNGNKAKGADGITKTEYERELKANLENLIEKMKKWAYRPQPARRVYIPKIGSDKKRPLGIPSYEDKLVQDVIAQILGVIYEPIFMDFSFGFRPGKSQHDALKELNKRIIQNKTQFIVEVDIKGFFDNVKHEWLIKFLEERITDPNFIRLITRFLKAGIMEEGKQYDTDKGTPQGGLISPILANVYLHYATDLWFEKVIKKNSSGEVHMVRYADDIVCSFQIKQEAEKFLIALKKRLEKFGLEIAEDKTKILEFGRFAEVTRKNNGNGKPETFDFLGFTHVCGKTRNNKFIVKRTTSKKKLKAKKQAAKEWLKENMHQNIKVLIDSLNKKLVGHYAYYGVNGNMKRLGEFRFYITKILYQTLNRRSQKRSFNWEEFQMKVLKYLPIAKPKIYVNIFS